MTHFRAGEHWVKIWASSFASYETSAGSLISVSPGFLSKKTGNKSQHLVELLRILKEMMHLKLRGQSKYSCNWNVKNIFMWTRSPRTWGNRSQLISLAISGAELWGGIWIKQHKSWSFLCLSFNACDFFFFCIALYLGTRWPRTKA